MNNFIEFLKDKKIDPDRFRSQLSPEFEKMEAEFKLIGSASFDQQKKFFLNNLRLQFPLQEDPSSNKTVSQKPTRRKPVIPKKPKLG